MEITRKVRMLLAKNFCLYYDYGRVNELSTFDLVIVEPKGLSIEEFKVLKSSDTVVITYFSLIEVHPYDSIFQELTEDDFILVEGKRLKNEAFGTYLVNLQSKKWIEYLLDKARLHYEVLESDGLFLDTIGDIELSTIPSSLKVNQLNAAVNFIYILKLLYPTHLFIQNNGLEEVCLQTAPYIDGICWENPPFSLSESEEWAEIIVKRLSHLKETYQTKIFLLLEETIEKEHQSHVKAKKLAHEQGFLLYNAPSNYVAGINK